MPKCDTVKLQNTLRLNNAKRIGEKIQKKLDEGYIIYTDEGFIVKSVTFKGFGDNDGLTIESDRGGHVVYFDDDPTCDNGMLTPIKEFNAEFKKWKTVHPNSIKSLI